MRQLAENCMHVFLKDSLDVDERRTPRAIEVMIEGGEWQLFPQRILLCLTTV